MSKTVRYACAAGLNVRNSPGGLTPILTLNGGDLMYCIPNVSEVTAILGDTFYVWIKVHYYKVDNNGVTEGEGWVAKSNTTEVSSALPSKTSLYNSNSWLKQYQMLTNARYIHNWLSNYGWSFNAICAILGNMEKESTINPGKWEQLNNSSLGFGLVQWTPATKYTNWSGSGVDKSDIDNQLDRIMYEVSNAIQWVSTNHSPTMTFSEFKSSTKTCSELAEYFLRCYEMPRNVAGQVAERQSLANKWSAILSCFM